MEDQQSRKQISSAAVTTPQRAEFSPFFPQRPQSVIGSPALRAAIPEMTELSALYQFTRWSPSVSCPPPIYQVVSESYLPSTNLPGGLPVLFALHQFTRWSPNIVCSPPIYQVVSGPSPILHKVSVCYLTSIKKFSVISECYLASNTKRSPSAIPGSSERSVLLLVSAWLSINHYIIQGPYHHCQLHCSPIPPGCLHLNNIRASVHACHPLLDSVSLSVLSLPLLSLAHTQTHTTCSDKSKAMAN